MKRKSGYFCRFWSNLTFEEKLDINTDEKSLVGHTFWDITEGSEELRNKTLLVEFKVFMKRSPVNSFENFSIIYFK